jgi:hypothetical protein
VKEKFVFKQLAYKPYPDVRSGNWLMGTQPRAAYFHLKMACLRKHNPLVELDQVTITNDILEQLQDADLDYLNKKGLLQAILGNKN